MFGRYFLIIFAYFGYTAIQMFWIYKIVNFDFLKVVILYMRRVSPGGDPIKQVRRSRRGIKEFINTFGDKVIHIYRMRLVLGPRTGVLPMGIILVIDAVSQNRLNTIKT